MERAGNTNDALPAVWPVRGFRDDVEPDYFAGKLGLYSYDSGTPLMSGTWTAAKLGADIALTAQQLVTGGERAAFRCRVRRDITLGRISPAGIVSLIMPRWLLGRFETTVRSAWRCSTWTITTAMARRRFSTTAPM